MTSRTTLKDLAQAAGLAVSTVSQALRDEGTVSRQTCQRIQQLAREMGYVPNPVIAAMASKRPSSKESASAPVALLLSDQTGGNPSVPGNARRRAEALGYDLKAFVMPRGHERELARTLYHQGYVGVILNVLYGYDRLPDFGAGRFSVVKRGRDFFPVPFHTVRHSAFDEILLAWNEIRKRGYRRIGVILFKHSMKHPDDIARHGAVLQVQSCLDPDETAIPALHCPAGDENAIIPGWFRQHRPDAILAFHIAEFYLLLEAGIPVGTEIGFACLNLTEEYLAEISGIVDSIPEQIERAVDFIDLQLRHHITGPVANPTSTLISPTWNEGTTLRPA